MPIDVENSRSWGAPAILGANGVEKIVEIPLDNESRILLDKTAGAIAKDLELLTSLGLG